MEHLPPRIEQALIRDKIGGSNPLFTGCSQDFPHVEWKNLSIAKLTTLKTECLLADYWTECGRCCIRIMRTSLAFS